MQDQAAELARAVSVFKLLDDGAAPASRAPARGSALALR